MANRTERSSMSLDQLIARMEAGWGWWRSHLPAAAGRELRRRFGADTAALRAPVEVTYAVTHWGWGPNGGTTYRWEVAAPGVALPEPDNTTRQGGAVEALFGTSRREATRIEPLPGGGFACTIG